MTDTLLEAALAYAAMGWPVFPCKPNEKVPAGEVVPHGFLDATTDPTKIREWWALNPSYNVAIATGAPGPDVVDVDVKPRKDGSVRPGKESAEKLKAAGHLDGFLGVAETCSGGWHIYFLGSTQANSAHVKSGIDFRGKGGYVLAPPSQADGGSYRVLSAFKRHGMPADWQGIREFLDPPTAPPTQDPEEDYSAYADLAPDTGEDAPVTEDRVISYYLTALEGILEDMSCALEGSRNDTLNRLAFRLGQITAGLGLHHIGGKALVELMKVAERIKMTKSEVFKTAKSGYTSGVKYPKGMGQ